MNKLDEQLKKVKGNGRMGLMTHVVIGYPTLDDTRALVKMMAAEGVDFIELQIPFSDPMGDGAAIRRANTAALAGGVHVKDAFDLVKTLRREDKIEIPFFFMTYLNIAYTYGLEKFCADSQTVGVNALIIPDYNMTHERVDHLDEIAATHDQVLIRFVSLDSNEERLRMIADGASGFVYCFSTRGITGARKELDTYLNTHLAHVRKFFPNNPLAVGFGISTGEHLRSLKGSADIAVVGSALLNVFEQQGLDGARTKVRELVYAAKS
jgi:tryptophan synthase alpha chain